LLADVAGQIARRRAVSYPYYLLLLLPLLLLLMTMTTLRLAATNHCTPQFENKKNQRFCLKKR